MVVSETIGGAVLCAGLTVLFERLFSRDFLSIIRENKEPLKRLKIILLSVHALMDDAEGKQHGDFIVREWLHELKEAIYDAEDLLQEIEDTCLRIRNGKFQVFGEISASFNAFFENRNSKIEALIDRLEFFVKQKEVLGLRETFGNRSLNQICPAPLVEESDVYGRGCDRESIVDLLLFDNGDEISTIAIVGMGGIGKTTLAQLVYNNARVKAKFELRVWVYVSDKFDIFGLTKKVLEAINIPTSYTQEFMELQLMLRTALKGKKFLLVLDDIWEENYNHWNAFKSSFGFGLSESKIIITTRSERVSSIMSNGSLTHRLDTVPYEFATLIFRKHAFGGTDSSSFEHLLDMVSKIIKKCQGLPLALKSLGGLLHNQSNMKEWEKLSKNEIWELSEKESNILPTLLLSYFHLPHHIKLCFLYCSIFYKGSELEIGNLISLWMAEGLLPCRKGNRMEDFGEEYIQTLISSSLFQKSSDEGSKYVRIHDLVHDMATYLSGEFCLRLDDIDWNAIVSKTRYLSCRHMVSGANRCFQNFQQLVSSDDNCLRTFISFGQPVKSREESRNILVLPNTLVVRSIRALSLANYQIRDLDASVGNLLHVKYLDLSGNEFREIANNTISNLCNLQTLLLKKCKQLILLPNDMGKLTNLRNLDISGTNLREMPPNMSNITDLQRLTYFVLSRDTGTRIQDLGDLQYLHGSLEIRDLQNVDDLGKVSVANLKRKEYLSELELNWVRRTDESQEEREVLEKLQPHKNLTVLTITGYNSGTFPQWIVDASFSNIVTMSLKLCGHCSSLPPFGQLPSLKILHITEFNKLKTIGAEFYYSDDLLETVPFRSLEELYFDSLLQWKTWSFIGRDGRDVVFPHIKKINLKKCPKLSRRAFPAWVLEKMSIV